MGITFLRHAPLYGMSFLGLVLALSEFVLYDLASGNPVPLREIAYAFLLAVLAWAFGAGWDAYPRARDREELSRYLSSLKSGSVGEQAPPDPWIARSPFGKELFAALVACDAAWRQEVAQTRERFLFTLAFSTRFAHEMKTPLFSLRLLVEETERLLRERPVEDLSRWRDLRRSFAAEIRRAEDLVDLLLGSVRLEDPAQDYAPEAVPVVPFVRELIDARREEWILRRIYPRIEEGDSAGELVVFADRKWLRLLLEQILRNALRYGKKDGADAATFTVRVENHEGRIRLSFVDEGPGIPPEDVPRVFEPFFTGTQGRKNPQATGIGLYLAREAALRMGAHLEVHSTWGQGTTLVFELPEATYFGPRRFGSEKGRQQ
ncbi:MAG: Two-component sensor kinase YvcQ [Brockia lithotrophica]|uniref:histidine kinase n=1 Tax=Brockia lithotrophica TaxID=933949 RepID=A0A2T5G8Q2_9BACL|nr:MAG: Two-component sensor kinase YvcQ [Brockia lithotrophica]